MELMVIEWAEANDSLMCAVYPELREMAARLLRGERNGHTLQRTALVHETLIRLWQNLPSENLPVEKFLALAAHQMRNVLIDYGRKHRAQKRTGALTRVPLFEADCSLFRDEDSVLALDEAMERLGAIDSRALSVVELKFLSGFTNAEAAGILGVSDATVESDWQFARTWLFRELTKVAPRGAGHPYPVTETSLPA